MGHVPGMPWTAVPKVPRRVVFREPGRSVFPVPAVARSSGELRGGPRRRGRARVRLRPVATGDVPTFYRQRYDPGARWMAAFGSRDDPGRPAFRARWDRWRSEASHRFRTVIVDDRVAGSIGRFPFLDGASVAYWYGRRFWGRGVATAALRTFLRTERTRPLFARVAHDNLGSRQALEKCGFVIVGRARTVAPARGRRLTELILRLGTPSRAPRPRGATRRGSARRRRSGSRGA
jgi:RimJ/RimL family protein N-acetyltransferase